MNTVSTLIESTQVTEVSKLEQLENAILSCMDRADNLINKARYTKGQIIGIDPQCPKDCTTTEGLPLLPKLISIIQQIEDAISETHDIIHSFRGR